MFDWLKVIVPSKKEPAKPASRESSVIRIDSRSYPLASLSKKGFVANGFDETVIEGQTAKIVVDVNDRWGKFAFKASVTIDQIVRERKQFAGNFQILPPEVEAALGRYAQLKKAAKTATPGRSPAR